MLTRENNELICRVGRNGADVTGELNLAHDTAIGTPPPRAA